MKQIVNRKYKELFTGDSRYYILMGGRSAGRSFVASQFALANLRADEYFRCAIMRYVREDIRNSIFQEILDRIEAEEVTDVTIKEQSLIFECGSNTIKGIGFKKSSHDQKSKLKSLASFNCIILEEADEISEEDFLQLDDSLRTIKSNIKVIFLLNPPSKQHWIIRRFFNLVNSDIDGFYKLELKPELAGKVTYIHTTYLNNLQNISQSTRENFESYKQIKPDHYWNMIMGLVSEGARGRIFTNWQRISDEEYEQLPYPEEYGMDFGFSNDPTSLVGIKKHNNKVYCRELIYQVGLTNQDISKKMEVLGISKNAKIVADSAEPKSIEELNRLGWSVVPATKGNDSVRAGIDLMLDKEIYYTYGSKNIDHEVQEYKWALDRNKEPTNTPIDENGHSLDAIRYYIFTDNNKPFIGFA